MSFHFRPYQEEGFQAAREAFAEGHQSVLLVSPCGSGKGSLIAAAVAGAIARGNKVLVLAHRKDLLIGPNALEDRLIKQARVSKQKIGYLISGHKSVMRDVVLGTVQTAIGRNLRHFDLLIVDEAHRIRTSTYMETLKELLRINPALRVMGFTATPRRFDGKGLGKVFQKLVQVSSHGELVKEGYLVETRIKEPLTPDLKGVKVRAGDYVQSELEAVYTDQVLNSIVTKWEEFARERKTIVFSINSKKQAEAITTIYRARGYNAHCITSDTDAKERQRLLHAFEANEFQVLVNVNMFTEGLSIDDVDCIVLAYATASETKYIQSASRGARPVWDREYKDWLKINGRYKKPECLLLDFGGNRQRFGRLEHYGSLGFDIKDEIKPKDPNAQAPQKQCPQCTEVVPAPTRICPECGYNFPINTEDDLRLATDVEWSDVDKHRAYFEKFIAMPYKTLWNGLMSKKSPEMLLPLSAVRGMREAWAVRTAVDMKYVVDRDISKADEFQAVLRYLRKKTKDAGYWETYQRFIKESV